VHLYCDAELKAQLDLLEDELRFVLITSSAEVKLANSHLDELVTTDVPGLWIKVTPLNYAKCERCWHRRQDVGSHQEHLGLCDRCIVNVDGAGEVRKFA
jgi:isoleucyl-tRNA synthetase